MNTETLSRHAQLRSTVVPTAKVLALRCNFANMGAKGLLLDSRWKFC